jgi:hypothetical protein
MGGRLFNTQLSEGNTRMSRLWKRAPAQQTGIDMGSVMP